MFWSITGNDYASVYYLIFGGGDNMMELKRNYRRPLGRFLSGLTYNIASAHGGGLDRAGCHNDHKRGTYYCH